MLRMNRLLSLLALCIFLFSCTEETVQNAEKFAAIPDGSDIVLELNDIPENWTDIKSSKIFDNLDSLAIVQNSMLSANNFLSSFPIDSLVKFIDNRSLTMAFGLAGANKYEAVFILETTPEFDSFYGKRLSKKLKFSSREYSGATIFEFKAEDYSFYSCSYRGLLMISASDVLLEKSVRQINTGFSILNDLEFEKLYKTANPSDPVNIYLNLKESNSFIKTIFPGQKAPFISKMGAWAELDLQISSNKLLLSGISLLPESGLYFPQIFKGIKAHNSYSTDFLPANTALCLSYTFQNAETLYRNYVSYLEKEGTYANYKAKLDDLKIDPTADFNQFIDDEMGVFWTASNNEENRFAYFKLRDNESGLAAWNKFSDSSNIEGYRSFIIKKIKHSNLLQSIWGSSFKSFQNSYFLNFEDYIIVGNSLSGLKGMVNDILAERFLRKELGYLNFIGAQSDRNHIQLVASNPEFISAFSEEFSPEQKKNILANRKSLKRLRWAALSFKVNQDAAFVNFSVEHQIQKKEEVSRLWTCVLESEALNAPQFVKNHDTQKYDIAVQDRNHKLYLISPEGKVLWTRNLDGPILGEIKQVDMFKNMKLQLIFNTYQKLYSIDRLGRDVENFPVKLKARASAGVGVFNYDYARNYRFVIPCKTDIYNYSIEGKLVKGWKFEEANSEILAEPQFFSVKNKDIITTVNREGELYFLNRKGEKRFKLDAKLPGLQTPVFLKEEETIKESELLAIGTSGRLYIIHPEGQVDSLYLEESYPAEHFLYFESRYIFSSSDMLFVKSDQNPWKNKLDGEISHRPKAMTMRSKLYVAAFSEEAEKIYLFNNEGDLVKGFPVFAQGPFDMGSLRKDGSINIVSSTEDGLIICYRLN